MLRKILGTVAGIVTWAVVVTALNLALRKSWADYAAVEKAMTFTVPMMAARLSMSGLSSLAGGWVAAAVSRESTVAPLVAGVVLLAIFLPYHLTIWAHFPVWYHLTFFVSLPLLSYIGGKIRGNG